MKLCNFFEHFPCKYIVDHDFALSLVVGCAEYPTPPDGAHIKYEGNRLIIWCNRTSEAFVLVCDSGQWKGDRRNCTNTGNLKNTQKCIK